MTSFFEEIENNKRNSLILMLVVFLAVIGFGYFVGLIYSPGATTGFILFAAIISLVHIWYSYNYGDKIVLRTTGAREADKREFTYLMNVVEGLCIAAGIPVPKVYVIDSQELNAFATGKDPEHASIAVTTGLMQHLNRQELEGVIAHELGHVKNFDIRFTMLVAVLVGIIAILADMFLRSLWWGRGGGDSRNKNAGALVVIAIILSILAPLFARLVQLAINRRREFLADATGAQLTRYPDGLAGALAKIGKYNTGKMKVSDAVAHLFFVNPHTVDLKALFSTHPPIEERIKRLKAM